MQSADSAIERAVLPSDEEVKLCVIGLGYVGLPLALAFSRYYPVVGFDIDAERIAELRTGIDRTLEATPEELRASGQLHYTLDPDELAACNVYIVTVPSPIDLSQQPDLGAIRSASELIARLLDRGDVVIYESTVYPGVTEEVCLPLLERSGLVAGRDFALGYSPERINPGDKTRKLKDIRKITAGLTPRCAEFVDRLYSRIIEAGIFRAASISTAEMAKVVENSQRDVNIALMNELAIM
ncbi:MAG: nucleotide sugar dehydrogenase, partial [Xanthomonadales bacterium]|nr:nucleotide sugar dehydrogenase [Xanthomonadales bacterium]